MEPFVKATDIALFFKHGYCLNEIRTELADMLLQEVRGQTYIESDGHYKEDEALIAPKTTNWRSPFLPGRFTEDTPPLFQGVANEIAKSNGLGWFRENFGEFSQNSCMVNKYRKNGGMVFHNDNFDATFLSVLIYLTKDEIDPIEEGGELMIARVYDYDLVKDARVKYEDAQGPIHHIQASHGFAVIVNNLNPLFIHGVNRLSVAKERYTFMCHYGYVENTSRVHRRVVGK